MSRGRAWGAALAILLVAIAIGALAGGLIATPAPGAPPPGGPAASPIAGEDGAGGRSLPAVSRADLPPEARTTLDRIAAGGPFRYAADGGTFENRERLLPVRPSGTYREYTVETPGSSDRGPRRIVMAATGEAFWTPDHYATFFRILP
jgi:ribonuclease T1